MDNYEVEFDIRCFKGVPTECGFLTQVVIDDDNLIVAKFTQIIDDNRCKETVVKFENNEVNYDYILKQRYYTVLKLIEINNAKAYDKIIALNDEIDSAKLKYMFYMLVSILCVSGAFFAGYSISNYNNDTQTMLSALLSSAGIMVTGLLSKIEYIKNKNFYFDNVPILTDYIENNSKKFMRVKR